MINVNELRVGNWVEINNHSTKFKVLSIDSALCTVSGGPVFMAEHSEIRPIKLTIDISLGLPKKIGNYQYEYRNDKIVIWPNELQDEQHNIELPCEFLHQFQNIYNVFTGEELQLSL